MKDNRKYRKQLKLQLLDTLWWRPLRKKMTPFRQLIVKMLVELFLQSKIETSRNWPAERYMVSALDKWIQGGDFNAHGSPLVCGNMLEKLHWRMYALGYSSNTWWEQYVIAEIDMNNIHEISSVPMNPDFAAQVVRNNGGNPEEVLAPERLAEFKLQPTAPVWEHQHAMDVHNGNLAKMKFNAELPLHVPESIPLFQPGMHQSLTQLSREEGAKLKEMGLSDEMLDPEAKQFSTSEIATTVEGNWVKTVREQAAERTPHHPFFKELLEKTGDEWTKTLNDGFPPPKEET